MYYVTVLLHQPESSVTIYFAIALGVAAVCIPLINVLSRTIGKRGTMILSLSLYMVILPMIYFFGDKRIPNVPDSVQLHRNRVCWDNRFRRCSWCRTRSWRTTDYDEKMTGMGARQYISARRACLQKITLGLSQMLMTVLFAKFGYSLAAPLGNTADGIVGGIFSLAGMIAFFFFPKD